jgi:hypothetical protein
LPADVTFYALSGIHFMNFIGVESNGAGWAALGTFGTTDAIIIDLVPDNRGTFSCRADTVDVCLILLPEIAKRAQNRIWSRFSESAKAACLHAVCQFFEVGNVVVNAFSAANLV